MGIKEVNWKWPNLSFSAFRNSYWIKIIYFWRPINDN